MSRGRLLRVILLFQVLLPTLAAAAPSPFLAYSLHEAQRRASRGEAQVIEVFTLGDINVIAGMVYDADRGDLILVGQHVPGLPAITLDDLAVAVRALLVHKTAPLVSIDPTAETPKTRRQAVRFQGGLQDTRFGSDLLAVDILLKLISLELEAAGLPRVRSYLAITADGLSRRSADDVLTVGSRFWFFPEAHLAERDGVFAIRALRVLVRTEVMRADVNGKPVENLRSFRDPHGDDFASAVQKYFDELALRHERFTRLRSLMSLVAVADGMQRLLPAEGLRYWTHQHGVTRVDTPRTYDFHERHREYTDSHGRRAEVAVSGGIELRASLLRLQAGDVSLLRTVVVRSRPRADALTWRVPIDGWRVPWASAFLPAPEPVSSDSSSPQQSGFYMTTRSGPIPAASPPATPRHAPESLGSRDHWRQSSGPPPLPGLLGPPAFLRSPSLPWQGYGRLGGVLLTGTARVSDFTTDGALSPRIDPSTGFSLIAQGENVRLADVDLRKFLTVLWVVYFGDEDPGISIDPISPESDRQLVRFVGNIVDTALARVLLDADYYMKQAAIGAVRPPVFGFRTVDELIGRHGVRYLGVGRRFWFVPEDIRFRRAGDALIFEGGRIRLMTEKLLRGARSETDASDEAFARFWTDHYWEFAAANPVFEELMEYAKMVALANYMKQSGVSLQWFLLANRHMVLRERIPGSVPALRAPSSVLAGVQWVGGVSLKTDMSEQQPGRYVIDPTAAAALRQALKQDPNASASEGTRSAARVSGLADATTTVRLQDGHYTIVPAAAATGGTASNGIAFHTDIALRASGEPGVELVRYNAPGWGPGAFGAGWHLYLPYRIAPAGPEGTKVTEVPFEEQDGKKVSVDIMAPRQIEVVDLIDGTRETLAFDSARFKTPAWVPRDESLSRFEGMALLTDGSFLLFEKSGARFRFDPQARLTHMVFSPKHVVRFDWEGRRVVGLQDTLGGRVTLRYDGTGKVVEASGPAGRATYRYLGNELATVDTPSGQKLSMIYRRDGRLDEVVVAPSAGTAPEGRR